MRSAPAPGPWLSLLAVFVIACGGGALSSVEPTRVPAATIPATTPAPIPTATPAPTPPLDPWPVTIAAVGDLMFARDVTDLMVEHGAGYPFERVAGLLSDADLAFGNLEGTFTDRGQPALKRYTFRTPPALAATLARARIGAVTLANNHTYDFGRVGLEDTIAALEANGVAHAGAGHTAEQAHAPALLSVRGVTIALLAYTVVGETQVAGPARPGVALGTPEAIARDVRSALEIADRVVVAIHAGMEYVDAPTEQQRALARAAIDAGASAVVGHHPHVLQGWERYRGGVILYSLGNFVFDLDRDDFASLGVGPFQTAVATITLHGDGTVEVDFAPAFIDPDENRPRPATPAEAEAILDRLRELRPPEPAPAPSSRSHATITPPSSR